MKSEIFMNFESFSVLGLGRIHQRHERAALEVQVVLVVDHAVDQAPEAEHRHRMVRINRAVEVEAEAVAAAHRNIHNIQIVHAADHVIRIVRVAVVHSRIAPDLDLPTQKVLHTNLAVVAAVLQPIQKSVAAINESEMFSVTRAVKPRRQLKRKRNRH